jgi:hypothetical protein
MRVLPTVSRWWRSIPLSSTGREARGRTSEARHRRRGRGDQRRDFRKVTTDGGMREEASRRCSDTKANRAGTMSYPDRVANVRVHADETIQRIDTGVRGRITRICASIASFGRPEAAGTDHSGELLAPRHAGITWVTQPGRIRARPHAFSPRGRAPVEYASRPASVRPATQARSREREP